MDIKQDLENDIKKFLKQENLDYEKVKITHPDFLDYGDFTFNFLPVGKKNAKNPREIAEQFRAQACKNLPENIEKIEVVGAGFLNFFLSKKFF